MKRFILILSVLVFYLTSFGQNKTQIITITDIHVEEIEGNSAFIAYIDSAGVEHYDMRFENNEVFVNGVIVFGYEDDILIYFNEEYAQKLLEQKPKILMTYYEQDIKYFGIVPFVVELRFILESEK
jgi:hypothetical protein